MRTIRRDVCVFVCLPACVLAFTVQLVVVVQWRHIVDTTLYKHTDTQHTYTHNHASPSVGRCCESDSITVRFSPRKGKCSGSLLPEETKSRSYKTVPVERNVNDTARYEPSLSCNYRASPLKPAKSFHTQLERCLQWLT